jgi:ribosomal protein S12 methylthiotransferase accessory factor
MDIQVSFPGGRKVDARVGDFIIQTDQSVKDGGQGSAPPPMMYCLASLATCAGFYVVSYLQSRNLPTDGVTVTQTHELVGEGRKKHIGQVNLSIHLPAGIDSKHHAPLIRAANTCAVKKFIESQPGFDVKVVSSQS